MTDAETRRYEELKKVFQFLVGGADIKTVKDLIAENERLKRQLNEDINYTDETIMGDRDYFEREYEQAQETIERMRGESREVEKELDIYRDGFIAVNNMVKYFLTDPASESEESGSTAHGGNKQSVVDYLRENGTIIRTVRRARRTVRGRTR